MFKRLSVMLFLVAFGFVSSTVFVGCPKSEENGEELPDPTATENGETTEGEESGEESSEEGEGEESSEAEEEESEEVDEDQHPWASFETGSFVKYKQTSVTEVMGNKSETVIEMKQTLVEKTDEKVVVENETTIAGNTTKNKIEMPLSAPEGESGGSTKEPKETGEETVTVPAGDFDCTFTVTETEQAGNKTVAKTWTSSDVPGGLVKQESETTGQTKTTSTMELVEYEAK